MLLGWFWDWFLIDFWLILASKIDEKSMKNRSKNRSKIRCDLGSIFDGSWVGFGVDLGSKLGPKIDQNRSQERSEMWSIFWWIWRSIFEAIWSHLGPQTPPKMKPSWLQNRCKLGCWFESCFVMDFGWIFIDFLPQHGMAEIAKIVDSFMFFIDFWYFGYWAFGLILGLIFDRFLVDFGVENQWKINATSIKKQLWNQCFNLTRLGLHFGHFWEAMLAAFGTILEAMLAFGCHLLPTLSWLPCNVKKTSKR